MGKIYFTEVRKRFEVMNLLTSEVITEEKAAEELHLSTRQIKRLKKRFIQSDRNIESLLFQRTHIQVNKTPQSIREKVVLLKGQGLYRSCQHIVELLPSFLTKEDKTWFTKWEKPHFHLSHQTIRNILIDTSIYEKVYDKTTPAKRFEMENFGELVQMDTSSFSSLCGYKRVYLILTLDDYSRRILAGRFCLSDTVYNNMLVLREIIKKYGIFKMLYTDNASLFNFTRHKEKRFSYRVYGGEGKFYENKIEPENVTTEIEEALLSLGIPLLTHYPGHPRAKGKIERIFRFINQRHDKRN